MHLNLMKPHWCSTSFVPGLLTLLFCALASSAFAQSITNPSFEANSFAVSPGTIAANSPIPGWSTGDATKAGLNPAGGVNSYANNGAVPNGNNVAFLAPTNWLSTTLSGSTTGTKYNVRFRANSPTATTPALRIGVDTTPVLDIGSVASVGGTAPYQFVSFEFVAAAGAQTLFLTNNTVGLTNIVLLDDFSINVSTSAWSFAIWTNDASSGVDSSKNYTHAYSFNNTTTTPTINGVPFTRIGGTGPQVPYELMSVNMGSGTTDPGNVLKTAGGGSGQLASQFNYNGNPAMWTLNNLVPGKEYVLSFYSVGWDVTGPVYGRTHTWSMGNDKLTINQDYFGNDVGIRVSYHYIAPASGYLCVSNIPLSIA